MKVGVALTDVMTGLYSSVAILAALAHRERSGRGQHIDLALLDVQIASLANQAANYLVGGAVPRRMGNAHPNIVPYQDFQTADGYMIIAVGNDTQFKSLCEALGQPEWAQDDRFRRNPQRVQRRDELVALLHAVTVTRTTADWVATLEACGVPCGPINRMDEVFADPHVQSRAMRMEMAHPVAGKVPLVANPIRMSDTPVQYRYAPPMLGEHTDAVLDDWLALDATQVAALREKSVV